MTVLPKSFTPCFSLANIADQFLFVIKNTCRKYWYRSVPIMPRQFLFIIDQSFYIGICIFVFSKNVIIKAATKTTRLLRAMLC